MSTILAMATVGSSTIGRSQVKAPISSDGTGSALPAGGALAPGSSADVDGRIDAGRLEPGLEPGSLHPTRMAAASVTRRRDRRGRMRCELLYVRPLDARSAPR